MFYVLSGTTFTAFPVGLLLANASDFSTSATGSAADLFVAPIRSGFPWCAIGGIMGHARPHPPPLSRTP